jgi:hypothetical protein
MKGRGKGGLRYMDVRGWTWSVTFPDRPPWVGDEGMLRGLELA